jgi:hypothetical protein
MVAGGVTVYAALLWALRIEERDEIVEMIRRKLRGKKGTALAGRTDS